MAGDRRSCCAGATATRRPTRGRRSCSGTRAAAASWASVVSARAVASRWRYATCAPSLVLGASVARAACEDPRVNRAPLVQLPPELAVRSVCGPVRGTQTAEEVRASCWGSTAARRRRSPHCSTCKTATLHLGQGGPSNEDAVGTQTAVRGTPGGRGRGDRARRHRLGGARRGGDRAGRHRYRRCGPARTRRAHRGVDRRQRRRRGVGHGDGRATGHRGDLRHRQQRVRRGC